MFIVVAILNALEHAPILHINTTVDTHFFGKPNVWNREQNLNPTSQTQTGELVDLFSTTDINVSRSYLPGSQCALDCCQLHGTPSLSRKTFSSKRDDALRLSFIFVHTTATPSDATFSPSASAVAENALPGLGEQ